MAYFKAKPKVIESGINWQGHFLEGAEYEQKSASSDNIYILTVGPNGPYCDCPGYSFNGKCKHVTTFVTDLDHDLDDEYFGS